MMKVLQISAGSVYRGLEKQQFEWLCNINNIKFDFISPSKNTYKEKKKQMEKLGANVYDLNMDNCNKLNKIKFINRLYKFLKNNKYDAVHINCTAFITSFLMVFVSKLTHQKRIIVHSHNDNLNNIKYLRKIIFIMLNPLYNRMIDDVISCSEKATYSLLTKNNIKKRKVYILKNGIDIDKYKYNVKIRNKYIQKYHLEGKTVYGHVGAFDKVKNHELLIDIFYKIQQQQDSVLLLVGEGILQNKIKNKIKKLNIENKVVFLGFREDVDKLLNCMDIFIFPSFSEGLGTSIIESQTNGLITYCSKGIQKEANISPFFRYFDLNENLDVLVGKIIKEKKVKREDAYEYTKENGYDIKDVCGKLVQIYKKD